MRLNPPGGSHCPWRSMSPRNSHDDDEWRRSMSPRHYPTAAAAAAAAVMDLFVERIQCATGRGTQHSRFCALCPMPKPNYLIIQIYHTQNHPLPLPLTEHHARGRAAAAAGSAARSRCPAARPPIAQPAHLSMFHRPFCLDAPPFALHSKQRPTKDDTPRVSCLTPPGT